MFKLDFPKAILFIICVEFCERLCYYTFLGSQKTFLQELGYENAQSSSINLVWSEVSYVACFGGGWLASTRFGIFNTIAVLSFMYACGTFLGAYSGLPSVRESGNSANIYLFSVFVLVAIGCGGIKPNVPTMGANQIDPDKPGADAARQAFFMYFYLSINAGSIISHAFLTSWATSGFPAMGITIEYGYTFAWGVAGGFMFLAFLVFVAGKKLYRIPVEDEEVERKGVTSTLVKCIVGGSGSLQGKLSIVGWLSMPLFVVVSIVNAFAENDILQIFATILAVVTVLFLVIAHIDNSWVVKSRLTPALDVVPLILVGNIAFGILMSAVGSVFQSEACQMDTRKDKTDFSYEGFQFTGDFFRLANPLGVIIGAPLLERVIYPAVGNLSGRSVSVPCKVTFGFLMAIAAQLCAAAFEYQRKASAVLDVESHCAPFTDETHQHHVKMSDFNAMWMGLPYMLVGIGEIMVNPTLQYVAYAGVPEEARTIVQALNVFTVGGLASGVASVINGQMKQLVPNDLNEGNLPAFYYVNTAIGIIGILAFLATYRLAPDRVKALGEGASDDESEGSEDSEES